MSGWGAFLGIYAWIFVINRRICANVLVLFYVFLAVLCLGAKGLRCGLIRRGGGAMTFLLNI